MDSRPTAAAKKMLDRCQTKQIREEGYLIMPDRIPDSLLKIVKRRVDELFESEGESAGSEFKQEPGCRRLANLVNKGAVFQQVISYPDVMSVVGEVLGSYKLSSLNVRRVEPKSGRRQPLHADMSAVPDDRGYWVCNTLWMLDDITAANGALRVVPGSHRIGRLPSEVMRDPLDPHPDECLVTGAAGTVVIVNAHLWHGGIENTTGQSRTAMHAFYCRRDKPQQQYQKQLLDPDLQQSLTPALRHLLALDDSLNDRLSADVSVRSFMK